MRFVFTDASLRRMYEERVVAQSTFPSEVVDAFFAVMTSLRAAIGVEDLHQCRAFPYVEREKVCFIQVHEKYHLKLEKQKDSAGVYFQIRGLTCIGSVRNGTTNG